MAVDQQTLWLQYVQALSSKVSLKPGEALQIISPYRIWNWGGRDPNPDSTSYEQWMTLNVVPSDPAVNAKADAASSQTGFDNAYRNWFDHLALGDLEHDKHYQELQDQLNDAITKYTRDYDNAKNTWKNKTGGTGVNFDKWLNEPGQMGLKTKLDEERKDIQAKQQQLDEYRQNIKSPVKQIQDDFNNTKYQGNVTNPNTGKSIQVRLWNTDPQNPYSHVEQITGKNFGGPAKNGSAGSVKFNSSSKTYDYGKTVAGGAGAFEYDFIGIEAEGGFEKIDWSKFQQEYHVDISWEDLTKVNATPGHWYSGTNITSYAKGPYATGFSGFKQGNDNYFFGQGGALSRIITGLVVAYRPTVKISGSSEFSSYLYKKWEQETGVMIGPFFFGGESEHTTERSSAEQQGGTITMTSKGNWPQIIGIISAWTVAPSD